MLDIVLLKIVKYRKEYNKLVSSVPMEAFDPKTQDLLKDFGMYFDKFTTHEVIDLATFIPRFKQWHPNMGDETYNAYCSILKTIKPDVDDATRHGILCDLYELDLGTKVANLCAQYNEGELMEDLSTGVSQALDKYKVNMGAKVIQWNDTDIDELLDEAFDDSGIRYRLDCLNQAMRPARPGDFIIVAARPDQGKTTFMASEVTFMASQLPEDKNIIWLNNEGISNSIVKRIWQSALGATLSQMVLISKAAKLKTTYDRIVGRRDKIRVIDIHGMNTAQVETILENSNPGIIIYDMIDKIQGFTGEARTDLMLEQMYDWGRGLSVKFGCIGLATSQISNEGEGKQFPPMSALKDSKTGKQGACDAIIMIGSTNIEGMEYSRYIGLPKNKLKREGCIGNPRAEVQFKPDIARYADIELGV